MDEDCHSGKVVLVTGGARAAARQMISQGKGGCIINGAGLPG